MSLVDWVGFVTGVICVALIVVERDVNWPIGVVNSLAFVVVFGRAKLYSQMGLQIFYVLEGIYGWWMWTRRDPSSGRKLVRIGKTKTQMAAILAVLTALGTAVLWRINLHTHDPAPFWDALVTCGSLAAEYMLCLKLYEAWAVYCACDFITLAITFRMKMWLALATYLVYTGLCVAGVIEWYRRLKQISAT
jgi:nicotinamide mononucleotide transporter